MFTIEDDPNPETVATTIRIDKKCTVLEKIDPRDSNPVQIRVMRGYLDQQGNFVDYGPHEIKVLDQEGYTKLLQDAGSGFPVSDLLPAIEKRDEEIVQLQKESEEANGDQKNETPDDSQPL